MTPTLLRDTALKISAFGEGEGEDGTLYVLDYAGGRILRVAAR
jgi:hypothetical protein